MVSRGSGYVAKDALLCFGLAALFRVIERRVGWAAWPTALMGFLILVVSVLSVTYLLVAGELLSWQSLSVGVARFDEVRGIAAESAPVMWLVGTALFVFLAVPYSCRRRWGSSGSSSLGFGVAVVAGVIGLLASTPEQGLWPGWERTSRSLLSRATSSHGESPNPRACSAHFPRLFQAMPSPNGRKPGSRPTCCSSFSSPRVGM